MKRLVLKKERVSICSEATGENMERGDGALMRAEITAQ